MRSQIKRLPLKRLLILAFMLLSAIAIGLPSRTEAGPVVVDSCHECVSQCSSEATEFYIQCIINHGTDCSRQADQYLFNCQRLFCRYGGLCG